MMTLFPPHVPVCSKPSPFLGRRPENVAYQTAYGRMVQGLSDDIMRSGALERFEGKVNLVFTSPPFPLNRKKRYSNKNGEEYLEWLSAYGPLLKKMLATNGSIVMEVGNAWDQGTPFMSTLPTRALLRFQEDNGLHLCQEFVWQNPAKLPSPAQWVNVERIRVKDSFTKIWWMCVGLAVTLLRPLFPKHHGDKWPATLKDSGATALSQKQRSRYKTVVIPRETWALRCMDGVFRSLMRTNSALPVPH